MRQKKRRDSELVRAVQYRMTSMGTGAGKREGRREGRVDLSKSEYSLV